MNTPWFTWSYLTGHSSQILTDTREHVVLTVIAVLVGLAISLPAALLVRRYRRLELPVLGVAGVLYTIPSLASIAALVSVFGLSRLTVEIPLTSYTLLILIRNVLTGLAGVPAEVREAARGMGLGPLRMLVRVELPLALPAIVAGIRIATVSTIALVTIGGLVGEGGLGELVFNGFNEGIYRTEIGTGAILIIALAVTADLLLLLTQRLLTPWARRRA